GYWKDEERTRASFVPDPFAGEQGGLVYKTGDLGRWLPDGTIEFVGRRDGQVKVRGFRVELGEIEAALGKHPEVKEAAVVITGESAGDQLAAYVVPAGRGLRPAGLREFLKKMLPAHMVPSAFVLLERLPLMPNGKVDRKALPAPQDSGAAVQAPAVGPRTALELQLAMIWES